MPAHRSAEPGSIVVRVGFDDRAELLEAAADVYYVTDHYLNYNVVSVRLSRVTPDARLARHGSQVRDGWRYTPFAISEPTQDCLIPRKPFNREDSRKNP